MSKLESILIGIALHLLCPLLVIVLFWWSAAAISRYQILPITERAIAISAIAGLGVGIILDILYVRKWIPRFYALDLKLMVLVYLFCSAIAAAFCMGLPAGNVFLGILAGVYIGRRLHYPDQGRESFLRLTKRACFFTATVTGIWTVAIGFLALEEPIVIQSSAELFGITREILTSFTGVILVLVLGAVLMLLQYWCTKMAARMSFSLGYPQPTQPYV